MVEGRKFNVTARGWFLTWPHCDWTKERVLEELKGKAKVEQALVCEEAHADGTPHVHAYVYLAARRNVRNERFWDLEEWHGNYQAAKSFVAVAKYVKKGNNFVEYGMDSAHEIFAAKSHKRVIAKQLIDGAPLDEVVKENPELLFGYKKLKLDLAEWRRDQERKKETCVGFVPNTWGKLMPVLDGKQKHYWIWSQHADRGKTTFMKKLDRDYRCSWYNYAENFQEIWADSQFVLMDEYSTAHLKVTALNMMCDGTYKYPVKGGEAVQVNAILIVCGNKNPAEIYPNTIEFIEARFNIIELN